METEASTVWDCCFDDSEFERFEISEMDGALLMKILEDDSPEKAELSSDRWIDCIDSIDVAHLWGSFDSHYDNQLDSFRAEMRSVEECSPSAYPVDDLLDWLVDMETADRSQSEWYAEEIPADVEHLDDYLKDFPPFYGCDLPLWQDSIDRMYD